MWGGGVGGGHAPEVLGSTIDLGYFYILIQLKFYHTIGNNEAAENYRSSVKCRPNSLRDHEVLLPLVLAFLIYDPCTVNVMISNF